VILYGMRVAVAVRRVANCYSPFTFIAGPTAANPPLRRAAADGRNGQTDGRTLDSFIDPSPNAT